MAYSSGDTILDDHYNDFATSVNAIWGAGSGDHGYGQTSTVSAVSTSTTIAASQWTTLLARISSAASHQGTSITSITNPAGGGTISAFTALSGNVTTIDTNRLSVSARAGNVESNCSTTTTLQGTIEQRGTWTWGSNDQARFFFNAGGRISCRWDISSFTADTKANRWNTLAANCGTYLINAQTSGKSGGSGSPATNNTNYGYYDLTTSYVTVFKQLEDTSPYNANFVQWQLKSSDSGASVETSCTWVDSAADTSYNKSIYTVLDQVDGTHRMIFGFEKHNTTHVADNGGSITLTGTATGS